jgi:hypothetical protein
MFKLDFPIVFRVSINIFLTCLLNKALSDHCKIILIDSSGTIGKNFTTVNITVTLHFRFSFMDRDGVVE